MTPERIVDFACQTGESPLWHPQQQCLYWVDIPNGRLFRYTPETDKSEAFEVGKPVGALTLQADGALLLFMASGTVKTWFHGQMETVLEKVEGEEDNRFNDVIADPMGRVFCGTMSSTDRAGKLYRLDRDGTITTLVDGVGTSNGMGFTPDLNHFFHTDTRKSEIYLYDYDKESGVIRNKRVFIRVPISDPGRPDGMTVDCQGEIWSARWDGHCFVHYDRRGKEIERVLIPAPKVSSVTFGGEDYRDIYVTTAGGHNKEHEAPNAGALFRVRSSVAGVPEFHSRIGL